MHASDAVHDSEPESSAAGAARGIHAGEWLQHALGLFGGNARPAIQHFNKRGRFLADVARFAIIPFRLTRSPKANAIGERVIEAIIWATP